MSFYFYADAQRKRVINYGYTIRRPLPGEILLRSIQKQSLVMLIETMLGVTGVVEIRFAITVILLVSRYVHKKTL